MSFETYNNAYIFPLDPDWVSQIPMNLVDYISEASGLSVDYLMSFQEEPGIVYTVQLTMLSRAAIHTFTSFFDEMYGRYDSFWMPSHNRDIIVSSGFASSATNLSIADTGVYKYYADRERLNQHLMMRFIDDTRFYCQYNPVSELSIQLSVAPGKECSDNEVGSLLVSFMNKVRFGSDDIELDYKSANTAIVTFDVISTDT